MIHKARQHRLRFFVLVAVISSGIGASTKAVADDWPRFPRSEFPLTDTAQRAADLSPSEFLSGGPPRDGIPAIDNPRFVTQPDADAWLADDEPVIAVDIAGTARAYPLQILMYHEIVNDTLAGVPISVTFCPLCNASIVFDRRVESMGDAAAEIIDSPALDFGTTGRLRASDLVMYDRQTETWWQQFTGRGLVGVFADERLHRLPSTIVSWSAFKQAWPEGDVLSRDTGHRRPYGRNPYAGYDSIHNNPFLFRGDIDPRLPPMERVLAIDTGTRRHLIPLSSLENTTVKSLTLDGNAYVVFSSDQARSALDKDAIAESRIIPSAAAYRASLDGAALSFEFEDGAIRDNASGSTFDMFGRASGGELDGQRLTPADSGVHFAFAWLAFDPDAVVVP